MEFAVPIAVVLVLILLIVLGMVRTAARQGEHKVALEESDIEMLRYRVPEGRDPAVVLAALQREGFDAVPDLDNDGAQDVMIPCLPGKDRHREHVRAVIENADRINIEGDRAPVEKVRFADE